MYYKNILYLEWILFLFNYIVNFNKNRLKHGRLINKTRRTIIEAFERQKINGTNSASMDRILQRLQQFKDKSTIDSY